MAPGNTEQEKTAGERKTGLITPPIEYERSFEQIKREVENSFLERTENTINEKRVYCLRNGLSLEQTNYILTTAIQVLSSLAPLKNEGRNVDELELLPELTTRISVAKFPYFPPDDSEIPENAFSL